MDPQNLIKLDEAKAKEEIQSKQENSKKFLVFRIIFIVVPLILIFIVAIRFIFPETSSSEAIIATPVRIQQVQSADIELKLNYTGNLSPESSAALVPKISAKVETILVEENDLVSKDQVLVLLEADVVQLQAQQAEAAWRAAEAQFDKARTGLRPAELESLRASVTQAQDDLDTALSNFQRTENLYEAGTISKSEYEEAENKINSARTEVENAQRSLEIAEEASRREDQDMARAQADGSLRQYELALLQLEYAQIKSPVDGRIAQVLVDEGNLVGIGTPILTIVSDQLIFARIPIPEQYYGRFQEAKEVITAIVYPIAYPNREGFTGSIGKIAEIIDPLSRTFEVEVQIENSEALLKPGMFVRVEFKMDVISSSITVPNSAIVLRDGAQQVFVINGSNQEIVEQREVILGVNNESTTEILSGLMEGEIIVSEGNSFLENGQLVNVLNPELFAKDE
jgi:HlyD family secretion protein